MIRKKQHNTPLDLLGYQRWAWKPTLKRVSQSSPYDSKFGGTPYLLEGESTSPPCQNCHLPMSLILQIHLSRLPLHRQTGVLQLFYCRNVEARCELVAGGGDPFSPISIVRLVPLTQHKQPTFSHDTATQLIIGWQKFPDFPTWIESHKFEFDIHETAWDEVESAKFEACHTHDKLGGWPAWFNQPEYPRCPICHAQMQLIFQLASSQGTDYVFGKMGRGWITRCAEHQDQVTFSWDCD